MCESGGGWVEIKGLQIQVSKHKVSQCHEHVSRHAGVLQTVSPFSCKFGCSDLFHLGFCFSFRLKEKFFALKHSPPWLQPPAPEPAHQIFQPGANTQKTSAPSQCSKPAHQHSRMAYLA